MNANFVTHSITFQQIKLLELLAYRTLMLVIKPTVKIKTCDGGRNKI